MTGCASRIEWIDAWKGVLILLVVLGHVVGAGYHFSSGLNQVLLQDAYRVIYSFHMPAFFFLAGMMWRSSNGGLLQFCRTKAVRLLIPYVVFGCASVVVYQLVSGFIPSLFDHATTTVYADKGKELWWQPFVSLLHAGGWPRGDGFQANSVLWFLPCLFTLEVFYWGIDRLIPRRTHQLLLAALLLAASVRFSVEPLQWLPWGLSRVPHYAFYLIVGRWCGLGDRAEWLASHRTVAFALVILYLAVVPWLCHWLPDPYCALQSVWWRWTFSLLALIGIVSSAALAVCLVKIDVLREMGIYSLVIMLLHKFVVLFLQFKVPFLRDMFAQGVIQTLFASLFITVIAAWSCLWAGRLLRKVCPVIIGERRESVRV